MSPEQLIRSSFATSSDFEPIRPEGCEPYPFQKAGVEFALRSIARHGAALVADEMGLGKSIQALCIANCMNVPRLLIVCPASLRINWAREAAKWLMWAEATIVGYEELVLHPERAGDECWPLVVYDEAQYLKNHEAKRTNRSLAIAAKARVFLSGTPIVNRPIELWPILHKVLPKQIGKRHDYGVKYCSAKMMKIGPRRVWDYRGASNMAELQRTLRSTIMVRRKKAEVLKELPPKARQIIEIPSACATSGELLGRIEWLAKARAVAHSPEAVQRLRDQQQALFEELAKVRHEQALLKVPAVVEHVKDLLESVDKVVIFAHHRDVIDMLDEGIDCGVAIVRGGMTDWEKQKRVDAFQTNPACRVFIGQIQAAGVGLTLTAASTVVFAELDWTPGNMAQCEDRCHRIGQKDSVLVQHLVLEGSLDARISKVLVAKQRIIEQALDGQATSAEPIDWVTALAA